MHEGVAELSDRWRRARRYALGSLAPAPDGDETAHMVAAWGVDADAAQRRMFDVSYALGRGFRTFHRVDLTVPDLVSALPRLGAPCLDGGIRQEGTAALSGRPACAQAGPAVCALWREAIGGLVSGLSSSVRHTRLRSASPDCADLVHVAFDEPFRYAPVPEDLRPALDLAVGRVQQAVPGAEVHFLGLVDGALAVRTASPSSGSCAVRLDDLVAARVRQVLPDVAVRNATPRPVLA